MLLVFDVGNTNTVIGLFPSANDEELFGDWRAVTDVLRTSDEWQLLLRQFLSWRSVGIDDINQIVICSVVPKVTVALRRLCEAWNITPTIVDSQTDTGLPLHIDQPNLVGVDRIVNAVALQSVLPVGNSGIVVDFGTATTLDVVSAEGVFVGGVILPGVEISLDALYARAAALKPVSLLAPDNVIGTNTADCLRSGATYGAAAQIDGLCERIEQQLGVSCHVISTGGLATIVTPLSSRIQQHDPMLTLRGLRLIAQRNA